MHVNNLGVSTEAIDKAIEEQGVEEGVSDGVGLADKGFEFLKSIAAEEGVDIAGLKSKYELLTAIRAKREASI